MSKSEVTLAEDNSSNSVAAEEVVSVQVVDIDTDVPAENDDTTDEFTFLDEEVKESSGDADSPAPDIEAAQVSVDMSNFLDDEEKAVNGVWLNYQGRTRVRLGRSGNSKAQAMLSRLYTANRALIDAGGPQADAMSKRIYSEVEAKCVVLGFENMEFAGMELPYSPRIALYLLNKSAHFKAWVAKHSNAMENFTRKATEKDIEQVKKLLSGI